MKHRFAVCWCHNLKCHSLLVVQSPLAYGKRSQRSAQGAGLSAAFMDSNSAHEQQKVLPLAQSGHPLLLHVESFTPLIGTQ